MTRRVKNALIIGALCVIAVAVFLAMIISRMNAYAAFEQAHRGAYTAGFMQSLAAQKEELSGAERQAFRPATGIIDGKIDINIADAVVLELLPGIGPALAASIIEYRDEIGGFEDIDQLLGVKGIGESKLEGVKDYIVIGR